MSEIEFDRIEISIVVAVVEYSFVLGQCRFSQIEEDNSNSRSLLEWECVLLSDRIRIWVFACEISGKG